MNKKQFPLLSDDLWDFINEHFQERGGVYKLFAKKDGKIIPVSRILKQDIHGVLYIGKGISLLDRVINLKKGIKNKSRGHICGRRYHLESRKYFRKAFPKELLWVELIEVEIAEKEEREILKSYILEFGESPPLNVKDY